MTSSTVEMESDIVPNDSKLNLKVPSNAWKWPPIWPFPKEYLERSLSNTDTLISDTDKSIIESFSQHLKRFLLDNDRILFIGLNKEDEIGHFSYPNIDWLSAISNSINLMDFPSDSFDKVVLVSGVEYLEEPRDTLREIWRVLKPAGKGFICFTDKPARIHENKPLQMWTTMNDEQKIWIAGSYFHYSAYEGWENLEGYDLFNSTGGNKLVFEKRTGSNHAYIVQATKIKNFGDDALAGTNATQTAAFFQKKFLSLKHLDPEDRRYCALRLASLYCEESNPAQKEKIFELIPRIESIFSVLREVKQVIIPSPVKSLLAFMLLKRWRAHPLQIKELREGLGLDTPSEFFWKRISNSTSFMTPREKIYLLGDLVNNLLLLSQDTSKDEDIILNSRMSLFPDALEKVLEVLQRRFPKIEVGKLQWFASDLLLSDFMISNDHLQNDESAILESLNRIMRYVEMYPAVEMEKVILETKLKSTA